MYKHTAISISLLVGLLLVTGCGLFGDQSTAPEGETLTAAEPGNQDATSDVESPAVTKDDAVSDQDQATTDTPAADWRILKVKGKVKLNGKPATAGATFALKDVITTGPKSQAILTLGPGSVLEVRAKSRVAIGTSARAKVSVNLAGKLWSFFKTSTNYEVVADNAVAGVRGTTFYVDASKKNRTSICACSGTTHLTGTLGAKPFDKDMDGGKGKHVHTVFKRKGKKLAVKEKGPSKPKSHTDAQASKILALMP